MDGKASWGWRDEVPLTRRQLLQIGAGGVLAALASACQRALEATPLAPTSGPMAPQPSLAVTGTLARIATVPSASAPNPTAAPSLTVTPQPEHATPFVTPNDRFYTQTYGGGLYPEVDLDSFALTIDGLVDNPVQLCWDEILSLPAVTEMRTLECISNPPGGHLIGNAVWTGTPLKPLLEQAGPQPRAREIVMHALDGYFTSLPTEALLQDDVLLVYEMNGEPLPKVHGYPLRILIPGRYGQKQPKWIHHLEAVSLPVKGYWESQGWSNECFVKVNSRIDDPLNNQLVEGEIHVVRGVAFAGLSGVEKLELSADRGRSWMEARLKRGPSDMVWVHWELEWPLPEEPGKYHLWSRATDGDGNIQIKPTSRFLAGTFPDGTSAMDWVSVQVRKQPRDA